MKTLILGILYLVTPLVNHAQNNALIGTWKIVGLEYVSDQGTQKVMETEIKAGTATTEFIIMEDGKWKQTSNMSGSGTLDTYEGTWKASGNKLIVNLKIGDQYYDVDWTYELKDNTLILNRAADPEGKMKIVNTFRKK
jgi:hypothetical protein